jgi:hypothetical protein
MILVLKGELTGGVEARAPVIVQEDAGAHGSLWSSSLTGLDTPAGSSNQTRRAAQISARLLAKCLNSKVFAPKFTP